MHPAHVSQPIASELKEMCSGMERSLASLQSSKKSLSSLRAQVLDFVLGKGDDDGESGAITRRLSISGDGHDGRVQIGRPHQHQHQCQQGQERPAPTAGSWSLRGEAVQVGGLDGQHKDERQVLGERKDRGESRGRVTGASGFGDRNDGSFNGAGGVAAPCGLILDLPRRRA